MIEELENKEVTLYDCNENGIIQQLQTNLYEFLTFQQKQLIVNQCSIREVNGVKVK
jgi:hypothetical protein